MEHVLRDRLYKLLGPFHKDLQEEVRGLGTPTFLQMTVLAATEWGQSTPRGRDANLEVINAAWHPLEGVKPWVRRAREAIAYSITTGHCIPDNIIVHKVLLFIVKSQAYKQEYLEFKALAVQDFAAVQTHFKQAEHMRKEYQDTAEDHGFGMSAEDATQDGMTKNMLKLANAMNCNETANAGTRNSGGKYH